METDINKREKYNLNSNDKATILNLLKIICSSDSTTENLEYAY